MIRIDRTLATPPSGLMTDGPTEITNVIEPAATATPPTLKSALFKTGVYGTKAVKRELWKMQHGKCCFCEKECEVNFGTVEHFRPKTAASEEDGTKRLGYWWLGYEFENLYLCCSNCNTPKGDYFPLAPLAQPLAAKALPWNAPVPEDALIVDPGHEDPEAHIDWTFVPGKGPFPVGRDDRGKATLRAVELATRDELTKLRARFYKKYVEPAIARYRDAEAKNDATALAQALADAKEIATPDASYAGMVRAMLRQAQIL